MPSSACALPIRSEEHTSELQSHDNLVCRLLLEKNTHTHPLPPALRTRALPPTRSSPLCARTVRCAAAGSAEREGGWWWVGWSLFFFFLKERAPPKISPFPHPGALRF